MTMKVGEKAIIKASPDYAYGAGGFAAWGTSVSYSFFRAFFRPSLLPPLYPSARPQFNSLNLPPSLPPHQQAFCPTLL